MEIQLFEFAGTEAEKFLGSFNTEVLPRVGETLYYSCTENAGPAVGKTRFRVVEVIHTAFVYSGTVLTQSGTTNEPKTMMTHQLDLARYPRV